MMEVLIGRVGLFPVYLYFGATDLGNCDYCQRIGTFGTGLNVTLTIVVKPEAGLGLAERVSYYERG